MTTPQANGLYVFDDDLESRPQTVFDLVPGAFRRIGPAGAPRRFEGRVDAVIAVPGHQGSHQTRARRSTGVKWFRHRAELLAHADGLRGRDAERHGRASRRAPGGGRMRRPRPACRSIP